MFGFLWLLLSLASADLAAGGVSKVLSARGGRSTSWSFDMGGVSIALGPQRNVAPGTLLPSFSKPGWRASRKGNLFCGNPLQFRTQWLINQVCGRPYHEQYPKTRGPVRLEGHFKQTSEVQCLPSHTPYGSYILIQNRNPMGTAMSNKLQRAGWKPSPEVKGPEHDVLEHFQSMPI